MSILYLKIKSVNDTIYDTFEEMSESNNIQENDAGWNFKQKMNQLTGDALVTTKYYYTPSVNSYFKCTFVNDSDAVEVTNLIEAETTWNIVKIEIISDTDFNTAIGDNGLTDIISWT